MVLRKSVSDLGVQRIITTPVEHHAVLHTAEELHHAVWYSLIWCVWTKKAVWILTT